MHAIEHITRQFADATLVDPVLVPFIATGARGNFPYFWQDPSTLRMNALTYQWIDSALVPGAMPIRLGDVFTTLYTQVLAAISFRLSSADQARLSQAQARATTEQLAVLNAWMAAFGSIPPPTAGQQAIDVILETIVMSWADPPTSLVALQQSSHPSSLLNRVPAGGAEVVVSLEQYLAVIGESVPLLNAVTGNTGRLQAALMAVQSPSPANGAILTNDGVLHPAWMITTPVAEILQELDDDTRVTTVHLEGTRELLPQLLTMRTGRFGENVLSRFLDDDELLPIELAFDGMARVFFAPVPFDLRTRNWYWIDPILAALRNGNDDVTGFFFSPRPRIDFGPAGPFAFLTQVVISKLPVITLRPRAWTGELLRERLDLELLGVPLASYAMTRCADGAMQLVPTADGLDARGWVHLVMPVFPAAPS